MKTMKKIVAILAVALMLCSILPLSVFAADDTTITFALGANGSASHNDGSTASTYKQEVNGYTLSITNGTQFYTGARDAKGNSCLKLGSSKNTGSFKFTVPDDVTSVIIYAAKYKSNTSKLTVNGTTTTLTKNSNDGAYDAITVDTSSTKTVTVASASGGIRVMINTIEFVIPAAEGDCEHEWELISSTAATCTTAGEEYYECASCGESKTEAIAALGHSYGDAVVTVDPDCVTEGEQESTCGRCGDVKTETVKALGHTWVDGYCDVCGEEKPLEATITFDNVSKRTEYSTNVQKWEENGIVVINNKKSGNNIRDFANDGNPDNHIRVYKDSEVIIQYPDMVKIEIVATTNDYATAFKNSIGSNATVNGNLVTVTFNEPTAELAFTLTAQARANSITAYGVKACEHVYDHEFDTDCNNCGEIREVANPGTYKGMSASEEVNGLAVKFDVDAEGFAVKAGTFVQADYTNATYNGYKLVELGVVASNGNSSTTIKGERMYELNEDGSASFVFRVINIPAEHQADEITFSAYYIVEIDGELVTIQGDVVSGAYAACIG